jgi:acyl CoA:acetate/3-ketoacid CoA transferase alpha subunit
MTPDLVYDQMIGAGCASALIFSWGGNPGVGSLHRLRDAVEHDWPGPLRLEEHSHAGMANRYAAGAAGLPFAVLRGYVGTDLPKHTSTIAPITCPFTGEVLTAVPALNPDLAVIHAQQADRAGNVQMWGITGVQKEAALAARRCLVTVEEVVDELEPRPGAVVLPTWAITAVRRAGRRPPVRCRVTTATTLLPEWTRSVQLGGVRRLARRTRPHGRKPPMSGWTADDDDGRGGPCVGRAHRVPSASGCPAPRG